MDLPRPVLVILSGLPASGKTTLAASLAAASPGVSVFSVDAFLPAPPPSPVSLHTGRTAAHWRQSRDDALDAAVHALAASEACQIAILDGTNAMRAARRAAARRVREEVEGAVAVTVDVAAGLEDCIARNAARKAAKRVPEDTIRRMAAERDAPTGKHVVQVWESRGVGAVAAVLAACEAAAREETAKKDGRKQEGDGREPSAHRLDVALRRRVSAAIAHGVPYTTANAARRAALAAHNEAVFDEALNG